MASKSGGDAGETKEKLLRNVKKEVKQIMEEAVTRKFVHEESGSITSLCGAVESCILHGLKKRALGLFKHSSTTALLQKVAKTFEPAEQILKIYEEIESVNDSSKKSQFSTVSNLSITSLSISLDSNKNQSLKKPSTTYNPKYLWIRIALFEKQLAKVLDYLTNNAGKYYEDYALIADSVDGPILASLLVGPCALDYTKMKTTDHLWTDPPADELVQRHRIHSGGNHHIKRPDSPKRPGLQIRRHTSSSSEESMRGTPLSAKEYVESLHQNSKIMLLYGKNNVMVQPKEDVEPLPGYLSLHQSVDGLTIKWTPNQLMNNTANEHTQEGEPEKRPTVCKYKRFLKRKDSKTLYWDYAVTVHVDEIVYLHCHQQPDRGGTLVLVGQDGVQQPPIHFPKGGHLLAFLSCLENGLLPHGQLDPPLWSQRGKESLFSFPGKVFPKLRRRGHSGSKSSSSSSEDGGEQKNGILDEDTTDYVFRIITTFRPDNLPEAILEPKSDSKDFKFSDLFPWQPKEVKTLSKPSTPVIPDPGIQTYAKAQQEFNQTCLTTMGINHRTTLKQLCDTMKKQIISRAFYGWIAHCRHLKTVRTHLSGLVSHKMVSAKGTWDASAGLTQERWEALTTDGVVTDKMEVYRLVYFGGVEHGIREEVWPYLLGHYSFGSTLEERQELDKTVHTAYEETMSEWLAVEAIVKQREKETLAFNLSKISTGSTNDGHIPLMRKDSSLSNEVFFESKEVEEYHPHEPALTEESSTAATTPTSEKAGSTSEDPTQTNTTTPASTDAVKDVSSSKTADDMRVMIHRRKLKRSDELDSTSPDEGLGDSLLQRQSTSGSRFLSASKDSLMSPASNGAAYTPELLDSVALNLHRIDKDVQRCDRNYHYFTPMNLDKLRNIMCTYVWEHLDDGYVQGMCDLLAPLLVILDDESKAYSCFSQLMKRMFANFPHGGAMDTHFANMRSLIQILDSELFEHMHHHGDYTHFYFCYRWFLLDFKRELVYDDVFSVWETIWAAAHLTSANFVLFIALALVEYYREIILDNNMDFTDIIKFFNEMAERHDAKQVLKIARDLVNRLQNLITNK